MEQKEQLPVVKSEPKEINVLSKDERWQVLKAEMELAKKAGLIPESIKEPSAAILILQQGKKLGMTPVEAFRALYVVDAKVGMHSKEKMARILKHFPQSTFRLVESDAKVATVEACRNPGDPVIRFSFTIEEAKEAGLIFKFRSGAPNNWMKYPAAMLRARAIGFAADALWPDIFDGISQDPDDFFGEELNVRAELAPVNRNERLAIEKQFKSVLTTEGSNEENNAKNKANA